MSFFGMLTPLYLLGLGALSLPIIFHLIRRTPTGEVPFSSLMFLEPSPPKLTKRSRLDNILLLLLRAAALSLLVFAFARPLFRGNDQVDLSGVKSRQVVLLVDTSASMRRGETWQKVLSEIRERLDQLESEDQVALYGFDDRWRILVDFDEQRLPLEEQRITLEAALEELTPSWRTTNLPQAIMRTTDHLLASSTEQEAVESSLYQIVLFSDLQPGRELADLQGYEWPESIRVDVVDVSPKERGNAGVRLLYGDDSSQQQAGSEQDRRVRIANAAASAKEQLTVHYVDSTDRLSEGASYLIPAGESRVVKPPSLGTSQKSPIAVRLIGDNEPFDNDFYLATPQKQVVRVCFAGLESSQDEKTLPFFLERALIDRPYRSFDYSELGTASLAERLSPADASTEVAPDWLVISRKLEATELAPVERFITEGGRVLIVVETLSQTEDLSNLLETNVEGSTPEVDDYALLGEIDFSNSIFKPFADPRFSDFTSIRFWKYHRLSMDEEGLAVLARFEDGSPFLIEKPLGKGVLHVATSGWSPSVSQLGLSSKFLPIVAGLAGDRARDSRRLYYDVGDRIELSDLDPTQTVTVKTPDRETIEFTPEEFENGTLSFEETKTPGPYLIKQGDKQFTVAVNLAAAESDVEPIQPEALERFDVLLGNHPTQTEQVAWQMELRDRELEEKQKMWSWLLIGTILFLIGEMWIAGRIQNRQNRVTASPTNPGTA